MTTIRSGSGLCVSMLVTLCLLFVAGCGGTEEEQPPQEGQPEVGKTLLSATKPKMNADLQGDKTIEGGMIFKVGQTLQSSCKGNGASTFGSGSVKVTVQGHSAEVLHEDATYNCAAQLQLSARLLPNNVIEVQETVTNPEEQANCVCSFDLSVTVSGLAPGSYTVMVLDAEGQLVDTVWITV